MYAWNEPHELLAEHLASSGVARSSDLAIILLRRFGSVPRVFNASWWSLCVSAGWKAATAVTTAPAAVSNRLLRAVGARPRLTDTRAIHALVNERGMVSPDTGFVAIYIDRDFRVIRFEDLWQQSVGAGVVDVSMPALRGFGVGAAGLFIARAGPNSERQRNVLRTTTGFADELSVPLLSQQLIAAGELLFLPLGSPALVPFWASTLQCAEFR